MARTKERPGVGAAGPKLEGSVEGKPKPSGTIESSKQGGRRRPEAQLQRALVAHLQWCARSDVWWTHIPNGGWRSPIEAAIFKSLGVRAGAPDLLIVRSGQPIFVELKTPGRKLSPSQVECHDALRRAGAVVETTDNIDQALAFLRRLGVLR